MARSLCVQLPDMLCAPLPANDSAATRARAQLAIMNSFRSVSRA
jgi:hypothetical protein